MNSYIYQMEEIVSQIDQLTFGTSMESWIILPGSKSTIASFRQIFNYSEVQYLGNFEVKYCTQDFCVEQSQYDTTTFVAF